MRRFQSIGALLTAITGVLIVILISIFALFARDAFDRMRQASDTLSVVTLKRSMLAPNQYLRSEVGFERAAYFSSGPPSADLLRHIASLHSQAEMSLKSVIGELHARPSTVNRAALAQILKEHARGVRSRPGAMAALGQPMELRPKTLIADWTEAADGLQAEIDRQSRELSRSLATGDPFITELLKLNDIVWSIRADIGIDRRTLAGMLMEGRGHPADQRKSDIFIGGIDSRWSLVKNDIDLPFIPPTLKAAAQKADEAYFHRFRAVHDGMVERLMGGEAVPLSRLGFLKLSDSAVDSVTAVSNLALSLTEEHAVKQRAAAERAFAAAIAAMLLSVMLGCFLAAYVMQRVVWPLKQITQIIKSVADGNLRQKIPFKTRNDEIGQFARTLQMFRDGAVEKQQLEVELVRNLAAREAAETSNRVKSQFLANMSHELRTPLNAILGFSEIIGMETFGPCVPRYRSYANDIHGAGAHLLSLINDILDISKAEAGKLELRLEPVDFEDLVKECARLMRGRASEQDLRLTLAVSPLPLLSIDRLRIKQVLLNLLSNAVKFTEKGGRVSVECVQNSLGEIIFCVRDTGIGIPPDLVPLVFEPFRQVDSTLSRKFEGTGLGLSLVRTFVELHGGDVKLESVVGQGTAVFVSLPASRCIAAGIAEIRTAAYPESA